MELIRHSVEEAPPFGVPLLILVKDDSKSNNEDLEWIIGEWTKEGWVLYDATDRLAYYTIYEWYLLPKRLQKENEEDNFSYRQIRLEDFWDL